MRDRDMGRTTRFDTVRHSHTGVPCQPLLGGSVHQAGGRDHLEAGGDGWMDGWMDRRIAVHGVTVNQQPVRSSCRDWRACPRRARRTNHEVCGARRRTNLELEGVGSGAVDARTADDGSPVNDQPPISIINVSRWLLTSPGEGPQLLCLLCMSPSVSLCTWRPSIYLPARSWAH